MKIKHKHLLYWIAFFGLLTFTKAKHHCQTDLACHDALSQKYFCNLDRNVCQHESLATLSKQYVIGIIIIIFISAFANAGGIGGGSVIVPALTIMFEYEVNEAIPLSKGTIFAGAVINVFFLLNQRKESNKNKSLIDYRLCAFMLPIMMCGTFFGVYLNFIFPPMIIIALLTGYLILSIFGLHTKYKKISSKEDEKLKVTLREQLEGTYKNLCDDLRGHRDRIVDQIRLWTIGARNPAIQTDPDQNENNQPDADIPIPDLEAPQINTELNVNSETASELEIRETTEPKPNFNENDTMAGNSQGNSLTDSAKNLQSTITSLKESYLNNKPKISFLRMIQNNLVFILILICSILVIVFLSLLKEGVFSRSGNEVNRCSTFGLAIMGVIAIFCFTIATIAFHFNITKEHDELQESVSHEMNKPLTVANDLNTSEKYSEDLERDKREKEFEKDVQINEFKAGEKVIQAPAGTEKAINQNIPSIKVNSLEERSFDFKLKKSVKNMTPNTKKNKNLDMSQVFHASTINEVSEIDSMKKLEEPFSDSGSTTTFYYSLNEDDGIGSTFSRPHNPNSVQTPNKSQNKQILKELTNRKSLRTLIDDTKSLRSEVSIETIIDENIQDKKQKLLKLGGVSFIAGTGAGFLGIGGGMIINPFLVIMNYSPLDAMAISSMGVLFTSSISTSEFLIMKAIRFSDLSYFLMIAGIGSLCGVFIIKAMVTKFNRPSILLMIILGIFIFAVVVLPTFGLLTIPVNRYFVFGSVCE